MLPDLWSSWMEKLQLNGLIELADSFLYIT